MNLVEASQHLCDNLLALADDNPTMEVIILVHSVTSDISMVSNITEQSAIFEVLTRGMASCFDPMPKGVFNTTCHKYLDVIKPVVATLNRAESIVCFWDTECRKSALISTLSDTSVAIAIVCEHMLRTLTSASNLHEVYDVTKPHILH